LAVAEQRTLLVDGDPQGNASSGVGLDRESISKTVYDVLIGNASLNDVIHRAVQFRHLDVAPATADLAAAEVEMVDQPGRDRAMRNALMPVKDRYDYVLIDCPPSLGLLTVNALTAADGVLIPLECEYFALRGMALLMDTIEKVREDINPDLEIVGILATMYDARTVHGREVLGRVEDAFGGRVFRTVIAKTIRFAEAPVAGESILTYAGSSSGAVAYRELAKEVLAS
jgi:chromosome partitioning protein